MRKNLCSLLFVILGLNLSAQGLLNRIPNSAPFIITLNAQSYQGKVDMNEISKMDFFNSLHDTGEASKKDASFLSRLFCKPAECGVQFNPQAYIFMVDQDSIKGWCYLFALSDANTFGKVLTKSFEEAGHPINPQSHSGYTSFQSGMVSAGWTSSFAILMMRDAYDPYSYSYSYEEQAHSTAYDDSVQAVQMLKMQLLADSIMKAEAEAEKNTKGKPKKNSKDSYAKRKGETEAAYEIRMQMRADSLAKVDSINAVALSMTTNPEENEWEKKEKKRMGISEMKVNERCMRFMNRLMNQDPAKSIATVRSFNESQKVPCDMALWMNWTETAGINPFGNTRNRGMVRNGKDADSITSLNMLLRDNYSTAFCTFDKGEIKLINKAYMNPEMEKLMGGVYKKKGPAPFAKYIKGTNLLGYASMSVDMEKVLKASGVIMRKSYESYLGSDAKYFNGFLDIISVFVNDDVMYNLFKGDVVVAVTDVRPFKMSYMSYTYDDNFKRTETRQEKTEVLPEFLMMADIGKPKEFQKILDATEKMGGLRKEGDGIYLMELPKQNTFKVYVVFYNNILFCTNNEELVHSKLKSGYAKNEQMTPAEKKLFCDYPVAYYWNGSKTFDLINKYPEIMPGSKMMKNMTLLKDNVGGAQLSGVRKEGSAYVTDIKVTFKDTSINSLFNIFKLVNSFYLADK
jgi:hypothetical protein